MRTEFSDMHNAMYGQKNLSGHMVAMRGKHGHAEGASHAEDIDGSGKPLPSGRWTPGRIRSIPEDAMLAGCSQMIWRSVKRLRRHGLLRGPVYIAMDFHDVCRCDKGQDMKFMRYSKHKNGTHLCNTLTSVHCVTEDSRACLGAGAHKKDITGRCGRRPAGHVREQRHPDTHPSAGPRVLLGRDNEPAGME